jgi:hypothetical protein
MTGSEEVLMATHVVGTPIDRRITLEKLDGIAWGMFFLWIGIALLTNLGWGIGLLGVGIIILGAQIARKSMAMGFAMFWVAVGALFLLGGIWNLLSISVSLTPIVCIVAGVLLFVSALLGKPRAQ